MPRGRAATVRPVPDRAALALEPADGARRPTLVVADLHLGLGLAGPRGPGVAERTAREMADELLDIAERERAAGLVVAGDSKHSIVGLVPPARALVFDFFSTVLGAGLETEVVLGNHDAGLVRHLPREVVVHPASGMSRDGVGIFHGHRWPSEAVLASRTIVAGHLHPGFRFAPTARDLTAKARCWVRARYPRAMPAPPTRGSAKRRSAPRPALGARELIVLPAFNPVSGIESLNKTAPARGRSFLFQRFLGPAAEARAYLLDGTDVGPIVTPERGPAPPPRERARAPRGR